jgi:RHS repeat-associated protein
VCTMETNRAANEESVFGKVDANGIPSAGNEVQARFAAAAIPGQSSGNGWQNSAIGNHVSRIGNLTGNKIGPNTLLRVLAGDEVSATTIYYYQNPVTNTSGSTTLLSNLLLSLTQAIAGAPVTSPVHQGTASNITSALNGNVPFTDAVAPDATNAAGTNPKAYLSIVFFDERFHFVSEGSAAARVIQSGIGAPALVLTNVKAPKNGYAYVYISNESDEMVYFDNLQVSQVHGRIVEENHYYAYGLKIEAISSRKLPDPADGHIGNYHLFNDKELFEEADLDWYDYGFRNYDPQIGRFPQLDPLAHGYTYYTPYQYAGCEPIANVDVDGLEPANVLNFAKKAGGQVTQLSKGRWGVSFISGGSAITSKLFKTAAVISKASTAARVWGGVKLLGSLLEMGAGAAIGIGTSWTGVGAVVGVAAVVHGADGASSALTQIWTGQETRSLTATGISAGAQAAGVDEETANTIGDYADAGIGIVLSGGMSAGKVAAAGRVAAKTGEQPF